MSEQVKVFKNVHTQTALGAAHSVTLATTGANEKAVIKEVNCKGVQNATLDLDGRTVATSTTDMVASGSLIMDNSSVLSLKFPFVPNPTPRGFKGMFFSNGSDGINYLEGDGAGSGTATSMTTVTNRTTTGNPADSSFTAMKNGVRTFFRYYGGYVYEYIATSTASTNSFSFGSGHGACTDGTYMYNIPTGITATVYRKHIETGVNSNFGTTSNVYGQGGNQGSFLQHHDGYLYSKESGGSGDMYIVKISDGSVTTVGNANISGSYSDGGCIVTTTSGTSYVIEQGTNEWMWYEIDGANTSFTKVGNGSSASTEYGNGAVEVAPGIAYIFCESSDDLTIIDMNTKTWAHVGSAASSRNAAVYDSFGDRFSICGYLQPEVLAVNYDAYTSGVLITQ
jgi:hypothetical protein